MKYNDIREVPKPLFYKRSQEFFQNLGKNWFSDYREYEENPEYTDGDPSAFIQRVWDDYWDRYVAHVCTGNEDDVDDQVFGEGDDK